MEKYKFTKTWFIGSEIHKELLKHLNSIDQINALEIGCFEGLSACFFSDNILDNIESTLDCVDPFIESGTNSEITSKYINNTIFENFVHNISISKNFSKITFHRMMSDDFFKKNNKFFNFIYIDGCHEPEYITRDMENSFSVLEKNGIMWMDDYKGGDYPNLCKIPIDTFLEKHLGEYIIIHKGYQLAIKKI